MSDEQKQQGVDLSGEYDVEQPKEAQPKAKTAVPAAIAQTPANGVDLSQDYEVGGKAPAGQAAVSTAETKKNPAYNDPTKENPYTSILTHPWESVKYAADYYTRPDEQPKEKPQANPEGAAPQLKVPAPAGLPQLKVPAPAGLPQLKVGLPSAMPIPEAVNPFSGVPNKPLPKSFTERPIPSLPTDEQITAAYQKMVQKGTDIGRQAGATGLANMRGPSYVLSDVNATATPQENTEQFRKLHPTATGVAEGVGGFAGGTVADPVNWALALSGGAEVPVLSKLASAAFSAKMGKDTLEGIKQLRANWDNLNEEQRSEEITKLGLSGLFAEEAGRHALSGTVTPGSAAANRFAGRDTAGESAIPTVRAGANAVHQNVVAPAVRSVANVAAKVQSVAPYVSGIAAGELVGHPWLGAAVGRALFPKERLADVIEIGRFYGLSDEDAAAKFTAEDAATKTKLAQKAKSDLDRYKASAKQGNAPVDYVEAYAKAQLAAHEATYHAEEAAKAAQEAKAQKKAPVAPAAAPAPEPEITAKPAPPVEPVLGKLGEPKAPPTVSPAHATTTIPQEPTVAPKAPYGQIKLPGGEPVGKQLQLTEGTPEGPQVPKGDLPKINLPEVKAETPKAAPKPERGNLRNLKVDETGKVVEKDAEGERLHQLLIESLKNTKGNENFPAATVEKEAPTEKPAVKTAEEPVEHRATERRAPEAELPEGQEERRQGDRRNAAGVRVDENGDPVMSPDVQGHWQQGVFGEKPAEDIGAKARAENPEPTRAETKAASLPKEEPVGYTPKAEETVKVGEEGRTPAKSAEEYHPAVEQKVNELSDENLRKLAKAHGLNPDEYDFNARDARRHRTERDQLAKDVTAQMGEDEKINLGRASETTEREPGFANVDKSAKGRANRAAKLFPRLRGPVDEFGNPKVSGGSPAVTEAPGFKDWFGKSKVVDEHGEPLQVYHGTRASTLFNEYNTEGPPTDEEGRASTSGSGADPTAYMGAHFAKEPHVANKFAQGEGWMRGRYEEGQLAPRVQPAYLNLENPKNFGSEYNLRDFIYDGKPNGYAADELLNEAMRSDKIENPEEGGEDVDNWMEKYDKDPTFRKTTNSWILETLRGEEGTEDLQKEFAQELAQEAKSKLKSQGYDGMVYKNEVEGGTAYTAFEPNQIKSSLSAEFEKSKSTVGTAEAAKSDTEHFANAKKELGEGASISDVAKRAQEMKDAAKEEAPHTPANYHGEPLSYTHDEDLHHIITKDAKGEKIGELVAKDIAPGTVEVTSNQVYGKELQGTGRGVDQVQHLLDNVDEGTHTVNSDISTTPQARGAWDKVMNANPDAVTKKVYKDGQTQYTVDMDKYRESRIGPGVEQKVNPGHTRDEAAGFDPNKFRTATDEGLTRLGQKKSRLGKIGR